MTCDDCGWMTWCPRGGKHICLDQCECGMSHQCTCECGAYQQWINTAD